MEEMFITYKAVLSDFLPAVKPVSNSQSSYWCTRHAWVPLDKPGGSVTFCFTVKQASFPLASSTFFPFFQFETIHPSAQGLILWA